MQLVLKKWTISSKSLIIVNCLMVSLIARGFPNTTEGDYQKNSSS